jgi:antitoxin component YwqK of YwqJK toxin-antitoxin module
MKKDILEYYPNKQLKHEIVFRDNGGKFSEQYYDQNGKFHREDCLPAYQVWHISGIISQQSYYNDGKHHNINNPSELYFNQKGKIIFKFYDLHGVNFFKLKWMNKIKKI